MKVAIAGAGITGAYLYRLLQGRDCTVHLYGRPQRNGCGLTSCAWGSSSEILVLLAEAGLNAESYILQRFDHLLMDGVRLRGDLLTIDKPRLIRDLLRDADIQYGTLPVENYHRVIDATGVARAFLPAVADDLVLDCCQYLVQSPEPLPIRVRLGGIGYAWSLPLGGHRYHVGCGSLLFDPRQQLDRLGWLPENDAKNQQQILCSCTGRIRLTAPEFSVPLVAELGDVEIWGVGEAIGCVAPVAGEGIVPGLRSVQLLLECWEEPREYQETVLEEFQWMAEERAVIDRLRLGQQIGLQQARILWSSSQRLGLQMELRNVISFLQRLGRATSF